MCLFPLPLFSLYIISSIILSQPNSPQVHIFILQFSVSYNKKFTDHSILRGRIERNGVVRITVSSLIQFSITACSSSYITVRSDGRRRIRGKSHQLQFLYFFKQTSFLFSSPDSRGWLFPLY